MNFPQAGGKAQRDEVKRSFTAEANGVFGKAENEVVRKILLNKERRYGQRIIAEADR